MTDRSKVSDEPTPPVPLMVEPLGGGGPPVLGVHVPCSRCKEVQTLGLPYAAMWETDSYLCGPCFLKRVDENGPRIITDLSDPKVWLR